MYKEVSTKIITILVMAAFLTVPSSSVVQYLHAQSDQGLKDVLNIHNQERGLVGVQPLTWSHSLAGQAQAYADHLTTLGVVCTSQGCKPVPPHGAANENIALGITLPAEFGVNSPAEFAQMWVDEKFGYNAKTNTCTPVTPSVSCGHYTQMVWQNTNVVGCGFALGKVPDEVTLSGGGTDFLVCRYSPPGNTPGQAPF